MPVKVVFTSKWWKSNKSPNCKDSGVSNLLAKWEKSCLPATKLERTREFDGAFGIANDLVKAFKAAKKSCGKKQKETSAGIDQYLDKISDYVHSLPKEQAVRATRYEKDRTALRDFIRGEITKMEKHVQTVRELYKDADKLATEAEQIVESDGDMRKAMANTKKAVAYQARAEKIMKEVEILDAKAAKRIIKERGTTFGASFYGVNKADKRRLDPIFQEATDLSVKLNILKGTIKSEVDNIETLVDEANLLVTEGQVSRDVIMTRVDSLLKSVKKGAGSLAKAIPTTIKQSQQVMELKEKNPEGARLILGKIVNDEGTFTQRVLDLENTITTRMKRIPDAYRSDKKLEDIKKVLSKLQMLIVSLRRAVDKAKQAVNA
ncbi:MAG: hypothetical protein GY731_10230 [Gammaproteobacteria bacterium]|nr:hypothetical protein [Gammaproteobacteria bacterium]